MFWGRPASLVVVLIVVLGLVPRGLAYQIWPEKGGAMVRGVRPARRALPGSRHHARVRTSISSSPRLAIRWKSPCRAP